MTWEILTVIFKIVDSRQSGPYSIYTYLTIAKNWILRQILLDLVPKNSCQPFFSHQVRLQLCLLSIWWYAFFSLESFALDQHLFVLIFLGSCINTYTIFWDFGRCFVSSFEFGIKTLVVLTNFNISKSFCRLFNGLWGLKSIAIREYY